MPKQTVLGLVLERMDRIETKLDKLLTETVPKIKADAAREAAVVAVTRSMIVGGITLLVSLTCVVVAYFK